MTSRIVTFGVAAAITIVAATSLLAAPPPVQNGQVETRTALTMARAVETLGGADPVWIGWQVPMVGGNRDLCSTWTNDEAFSRGTRLEPGMPGMSDAPAVFAPPPTPLPLEAGSRLVVLVRVVGKSVERLRLAGGDCPLDAGGRSFYWLDDATPAASLQFLNDLTAAIDINDPAARGTATAAIRAISLHNDARADAMLDRWTGSDVDPTRRRAAATALENRGAHGLIRLTALVANEPNADLRRSFVTAIGRTWEPGTSPALLQISRTDVNPSVRGEALYQYGVREGATGTSTVLAAVKTDPDDQVKRRGVSAIATLPPATATPVLIDLARSSGSVAVRRAAVSALGGSKDARAATFLEELIQKP